MMKRREFISLLGGAAATWPLAVRAQQPTTSRKVGVLHPGESTTVNMRVAAIREGLNGPDNQRDLSLDIIVRLADGDVSRLPALATDLVNNRVDAIVAARETRGFPAPPLLTHQGCLGGALVWQKSEIEHSVMAITSAEAIVRHLASGRPVEVRGNDIPGGEGFHSPLGISLTQAARV